MTDPRCICYTPDKIILPEINHTNEQYTPLHKGRKQPSNAKWAEFKLSENYKGEISESLVSESRDASGLSFCMT